MQGHGYSWTVEVTVFKRTSDDGDYQVERVHEAVEPHDSFDAGIRDAALQALGVVCGQHQGELGRTKYEFYPQRDGGSLAHTFPATNRLADVRLVQQVRLTEILLRELLSTHDELDEMYERYDDAQSTIKDLQEQLALEDSDAEEDPVERPDPIRSPPRKKVRQEAATVVPSQDAPADEEDDD